MGLVIVFFEYDQNILIAILAALIANYCFENRYYWYFFFLLSGFVLHIWVHQGHFIRQYYAPLKLSTNDC